MNRRRQLILGGVLVLVLAVVLPWIWRKPAEPVKPTAATCPTWFKAYVKEQWKATECVWEGRPDFIPVYRGWVQASSRATLNGDLIQEEVTVGFSSLHFHLARGKKSMEVVAFGPVAHPKSRYGDPVADGNTVRMPLRVTHLLKKGYGQISLTFRVERPALAAERDLLNDGYVNDYNLDIWFQEAGDRLVLTLGDPRRHLWYGDTVYRWLPEWKTRQPESVPHFIDKWYDSEGRTTRVVATRASWQPE